MRYSLYTLFIVLALSITSRLQASNDTPDAYLMSNSMTMSGEAPSTPSTPSTTQYCGYTRVKRSTPPSGVTYYWQTSSTGTSTSLSVLTYDKTSNGYLYLRAYNGQWSPACSVYVYVKKIPSEPSTSGASRCGSGTVTLSATPPSGASIRWYQGSTYKSANESYSPSVTTTTVFKAKSYQNGCYSSGRSVVATVKTVPSTPGGTDGSECAGVDINIKAYSSTSSSTIKWYEGSNYLGSSGNNVNFTVRPTTTTTYTAKAYLNGCYSSPGYAQGIVKPIPSTPSASGVSRCGAGTVLLSASTTTSGASIKWYLKGSTSVIASETTYSPDISGTTTYTTKSYLNGCYSSGRDVTATIKTKPAKPTASDTSRCGPGSVTLIAYTGTSGATVKWYEGTSYVTTLSSGANFNTSINSTTTYTAKSYLTNGCYSDPKSVDASVKTVPVLTAIDDRSSCGGSTIIFNASVTPSDAIVNWTSGTLSGSGESFTISSLGQTQTVIATAERDGCPGNTQTAQAIYNPRPPTPTISGESFLCGTDIQSLILPAGITEDDYDINWYINNNTTSSSSESTYSPPSVSVGSTTNYKAVINYKSVPGCTNYDIQTVETRERPVISDITDKSTCGVQDVSFGLSSVTPSNAIIYWTNGTLTGNGESYTIENVSKNETVTVYAVKNECYSTTKTADITYKIKPTVQASGDTRVEGGIVNLSATASPTESIIKWYLEGNTTTDLSEGTSYKPTVTSNKVYMAKATYNGCNSSFDYAPVTIIPLQYSFSSPQSTVPPGATEGVPMKSKELGIDYIPTNTLQVGGSEYTEYLLYPNDGSVTVDFECNTNWEITNIPSWLTPAAGYSSSGTGNFTLSLDFERYFNSGTDREDYIELNVGVNTADRIYLSQPSKTLTGEVTGGTFEDNSINCADVYLSSNTISLGGGSEALQYNISNLAHNLEIQVTADDDVNWNLEIPVSDPANSWIQQPDVMSGTGNQTVIVPIDGNSGSNRTGTIKLMSDVIPVYTIYLEQLAVKNYRANTPMNYVKTTTYGEEGRITGQGIQYYDKLGKPTQTLARDLSKNLLVANQTVYDNYGRPSKTWLPVPVCQQSLDYIPSVVETSNYDDKNDVMRYYDDDNTDEPYVPDADYPYTSVDYSQTIPGAVRKNFMTGEQKGSGISKYSTGFTVNASPDEIMELDFLDYVNLKELKSAYNVGNDANDYKGMTKSVSKDVMGKESVTYYNAEGQVIASAMTGTSGVSRKYIITNTIKTDGEVGYADIHLPNDGLGNYTITKGSTWETDIVNLEDDALIVDGDIGTSISNIPPGFYRVVCMDENEPSDEVTLTYNLEYKYYSFNAYDDAGRLVKTISPKDVEEIISLSPSGTNIATVLEPRLTKNSYGAFGRLMSSESPDEGLTKYLYRRDGSIRFSQNAVQRDEFKFSYTNYDEHGRVVEVGEYEGTQPGSITFDMISSSQLEEFYSPGDGFDNSDYCHDRTYTLYGKKDLNIPRAQKFLRGRVSKTWNANSSTWYSYNYDGTVAWTIQEIDSLDLDNDGTVNLVSTAGIEDIDDLVTLDYTYDFTGNVTDVIYQKYKADEFTHYYNYDLDNRLQAVYTRTNDNFATDYAGYWPLSGNTNDYSDALNNGTVNGAKLTTDRFNRENSAYEFDGVDDYIKFDQEYSFTSTDPWSVSMWIDWNDYSVNQAITFLFGKETAYGDCFAIRHGDAASLRNTSAAYSYINYDQNLLFNAGWNQITVVANGAGNLSFYINGTLIQTVAANTEFVFDAVGKAYPSTNYSFNGSIDDIRIYTRALSNTEVSGIYAVESTPSPEPTLQAKYYYYDHGPLKRVEYGENLQGVDYVYNIQGWLKSINNPNGTDPGSDGSGEHANFAADIFAMALDYYNGDYERYGVDLGNAPTAANYDGNIYQQRFNNTGTVASTPATQATWRYAYNERNYLASATFGSFSNATSAFTAGTPYQVSNLTYDANGNILTLIRRDQNGWDLEDMRYYYKTGKNQLDHINDAGDCEEDGMFLSQDPGNYSYNNIGQLTKDDDGPDGYSGHRFTYDVYGKVTEVRKKYNDLIAQYTYNESGFRIKKYLASGTKVWNIRDASGNILATYTTVGDITTLREQPLYASGRIGLAKTDADGNIAQYTYELTDHLGNVRATFTNDNNADNAPDILSAADYYPFGHEMPDRTFTSQGYRFGYQGQFAEKDNETGYNQFELRLYDSRIGRWLNTDPMYEFWSPYLANGNDPVNLFDPTGGGTEDAIVGSDGTFRGYDDKGDNGKITIYDGEFFEGMKHALIMANGGKSDVDFFIENNFTCGQVDDFFIKANESFKEYRNIQALILTGGLVAEWSFILSFIPGAGTPKAPARPVLPLRYAVNQGNTAMLRAGYYEVRGLRFSEYYYTRLWNTGRGAPGIVAKTVLEDAEQGAAHATKKGFYWYIANGWEMVYNPLTKEVWHLQPIK